MRKEDFQRGMQDVRLEVSQDRLDRRVAREEHMKTFGAKTIREEFAQMVHDARHTLDLSKITRLPATEVTTQVRVLDRIYSIAFDQWHLNPSDVDRIAEEEIVRRREERERIQKARMVIDIEGRDL